jgi:CubicO group peptidase (beta-lactamase class C family)
MAHLNDGPALKAERDLKNYWRARLAAACSQMQIDHASLAIQDGDLTTAVEYAHAQMLCEEPDKKYPALCVAKLFTSTLIVLLVSQRKLAFTSLIGDVLPEALRAEVLQGISVAHLLSHTHGLGCDDLPVAPTDSAGFIDTESVVASLQRGGRVFAPGKFFSYGTAGYILLGSVIEHVTHKPFGIVLREEILICLTREKCYSQPLDYLCDETAICPSSGKGLNLPLDDLLEFAGGFVAPGANTRVLPEKLLTEIFSARQSLPGWSPIFSGCCYGWKNFGHGWYGHNGIDNEQLMYLRINRTRNTAICLAATSAKRSPGALPSLLFRTAYPALCFSNAMQPRVISEPSPNDCESIVGIFGRGHLRFHITLQHGKLFVEVRTTVAGHTIVAHQCYLRATEEHIYFLERPWQNIAFLQLVTDESARRYLWDHTQLWPEVVNA